MSEITQPRVGIIGAGPGGLTAAYWLQTRFGIQSTVFEATSEIGGISQTVNRDGWRFDIGGHRFFSKVSTVEELWHEILPKEDFLLRPRLSRIFYKGKFFDYPLKPLNALTGLGIFESIRCVFSYALAKVNPPKDQSSFETWVAARFGWRLYSIFFKTYTEKVWGIPASSIQADWAAQRIKNLNLANAIINALKPSGKRGKDITTLIEEFEYPRLGPGMMWEVCTDKIVESGCKVLMNQPVQKLVQNPDSTWTVHYGSEGQSETFDHVISTMPINLLCKAIEPILPAKTIAAANSLKHRDFLTVALVVPVKHSFPDNWIYIHSPEVTLGRIQNFISWSPEMIPQEGYTCLGLEYFVNEGDRLWEMQDDALIKYASKELEKIGLVPANEVTKGYVVRMPKAYPVYDEAYGPGLQAVRSGISSLSNLHPIGRNGMHRYNNQDHSMMTAILTAENIALGSNHDIWEVNVEEDYHEAGQKTELSLTSGTGRTAPMLKSSN
jgi:protoporphyrinogen oxidase